MWVRGIIMKLTRSIVFIGILFVVFFILTSCSTSRGTLTLQLTDAPAELNIEKMEVTLSKVQVHKADQESNATNETNSTTESGWITIIEQPQTFDLIAIKDVKEFLGTASLVAGKYTQVRLTVEKAVLTVNGQEYPLAVPSEKIKLIHPFTIVANQNTTLTLDFDAQKSVTSTGSGKYNLKPTIKVIQEP